MSLFERYIVRVLNRSRSIHGFNSARLFIIAASLFSLVLSGNITRQATMQDRNGEVKQSVQKTDVAPDRFDRFENRRMKIHPLDQVFAEAASEFGVPVEILKAVAYEASRWNHLEADPEKNETIGIMGLKSRFPGDTLERAAQLINRSPESLAKDAVDNIRGAAALLGEIAREMGYKGVKHKRDLSDWVEALARYSGIESTRLNFEYVSQVYYFINFGVDELLSDGRIFIPASPIDFGEKGLAARMGLDERDFFPLSTDYGPAIWDPSPNYTAGRSQAIDTVVIHDVEGSYTGAISWFKNPDSQVSAHYVIRSSDGQITQMVRNADTAWHVRCYNSRSIGIEHEGFAATGYQWYTDIMYKSSAALTRYLCNLYGIPMQHTTVAPGIVGHADVSQSTGCTTHTDPGPYWDWVKYIGLVNGLEIIVDNSSSYFNTSSKWWSSVNVGGYYGTNYGVRNTQSVSDPATFNLPSHGAGNYAVYAWWTAASDRAASAPYIIYHNGTTNTIYANQQTNGGQWNYLGTFFFNGSSSENIKLSCRTTKGYYVIADAVRLVKQ
jgi:hypothetical protein